MTNKYSSGASDEVRKTMEEYKRDKAKFKSRKQAVAVGLSKARHKGERVPGK